MLLLDTCVVSELRKIRLGRADKNVAKWADCVDAVNLYLSAITVQGSRWGRFDPVDEGAHFGCALNQQFPRSKTTENIERLTQATERGDKWTATTWILVS